MLLRVLAAIVIAALTFAGTAEAAKLRTFATIPMRLDGGSPGGLTNVNGTLYGLSNTGGLYSQGAIFTIDPATGKEAVVFSFPAGSDNIYGIGSLLYFRGLLYGIANTTLFSFDPSTGAYSTLHVFDGAGLSQPPIQLTPIGGVLYGNSCITDGTLNGLLFKYDPSSGTVTTVYTFKGGADGNCPTGLVANTAGTVYGATALGGGSANAGTIFSFDPSSDTETVLYSFQKGTDGASPGALAQAGSLLYGTSGLSDLPNQIFSFDPATSQLKVVYIFPPGNGCAGVAPYPLLTLKGKLYGNAQFGGAQGECEDELYSFDPASNTTATVYAISADTNTLVGIPVAIANVLYLINSNFYLPNANLSGATILGQKGQVLKVDLNDGTGSVLHSFVQPDGGDDFTSTLLRIGRLYYGVSAFGGANNRGALFSFDPVSHVINVLHAFNGSDGSNPHGDLLYLHGSIWGTTLTGGSHNAGVVFTFDPKSSMENVAYSFGATTDDGVGPRSGLVYVNNVFYGTTSSGGVHGDGTIYSFHAAGSRETVEHAFAGGSDGTLPSGALTPLNGLLYGTTQGSYTKKLGTLFSFDPATAQENVLFNFDGTSRSAPQGAHPYAGVTADNGLLYGTTRSGGAHNEGTVFSFDPASRTHNVIYAFNYYGNHHTPGTLPVAPLTVSGTKLLGSTSSGHIRRPGVVSTEFSLDTATGVATFDYGFTGGSDGAVPTSALTAHGTALLGTTSTSTDGSIAGTVFTRFP
jgi:uncharacterized repeat protein (TIGR03803 family)